VRGTTTGPVPPACPGGRDRTVLVDCTVVGRTVVIDRGMLNDADRRAVIDALTREPAGERRRILASTDSFDSWLTAACPGARCRIADRVEPVRNWLRMAFC
jgi:hypothetical protein